MKTNQNRPSAEATARAAAEKENATAGNRGADGTGQTTGPNFTAERERGLYLPLSSAQLRKGATKSGHKNRSHNREAGGPIDPVLAAVLALATVAVLLLMGAQP